MRFAVVLVGVSLMTLGCDSDARPKAAADTAAAATSAAATSAAATSAAATSAAATSAAATSAATASPAGSVGQPDIGVTKHFGSKFSLDKGEPLNAALARLDGALAKRAQDKAAQEPAAAGDESCAETAVESCGEITADEGGELVRVSGTVHSVCKKAGCWMVLQDGDKKVRIFTKEHGFFLPKDTAAGRSAEVEGTLRAKTLSKKFAQHLAEDNGDDTATVTGPTQEYLMTATAITLL